MKAVNKLSNNQIRMLGDRLRDAECSKQECSKEDLYQLQDYRVSFKESLKEVFNNLSEVSKTIHSGRIVSFRVKKIDTILSKLSRFESMELDRMGDIAGCRCIVQSTNAIYKICEILTSKFEKVRIKDRISKPDEDGYRALHMYVTPKNVSIKKQVEIQLRTNEQHYWSTLVEIIDVLFDTKIKEGDKSVPELNEFLKLYSNKKTITITEKLSLIKIEGKHSIYSNMIQAFSKNILKLRDEWLNIKGYNSQDSYLIFEVDKFTKISSIKVFNSFEEAENEYFKKYSNSEKDILVSQLDINNFNQLSIAYSNYILTSHNFQDAWHKFLYDLIIELNTEYDKANMKFVYKIYERIVSEEQKLFEEEFKSIDKNYEEAFNDISKLMKVFDWMEAQSNNYESRLSKFKKLKEKVDLDELDFVSIFISKIYTKIIKKFRF